MDQHVKDALHRYLDARLQDEDPESLIRLADALAAAVTRNLP